MKKAVRVVNLRVIVMIVETMIAGETIEEGAVEAVEEDTPEEGEAERAVEVAEEGDTHVVVEEGEKEVATVVVVEEEKAEGTTESLEVASTETASEAITAESITTGEETTIIEAEIENITGAVTTEEAIAQEEIEDIVAVTEDVDVEGQEVVLADPVELLAATGNKCTYYTTIGWPCNLAFEENG